MPYEHPTLLPAGVAVAPNKAAEPVEPKTTRPQKQPALSIHPARSIQRSAAVLRQCLKRGLVPESLEQIGAIRAEIDELETQLRN